MATNTRWSIVVIWLYFIVQILQLVEGNTIVHIRMVRYKNPTGKENDFGLCCDNIWPWANCNDDPCDHRFIFCFDYTYGSDDYGNCPYGQYRMNGHIESNDITFGDDIGGIANPILLRLHRWEGGVKLKCDVEDDDDAQGNDHDKVDFLKYVYTATPARSEDQALVTETTILGDLSTRTELTVQFKVYCDSNYYGSSCSIYCSEHDDSRGHYTCDQNGNKICMAGWEGTDCVISVNDCIGHQCQNDGTCRDGHLIYTCICLTGFTGPRQRCSPLALERTKRTTKGKPQRIYNLCYLPAAFVSTYLLPWKKQKETQKGKPQRICNLCYLSAAFISTYHLVKAFVIYIPVALERTKRNTKGKPQKICNLSYLSAAFISTYHLVKGTTMREMQQTHQVRATAGSVFRQL
ncbi:unnamed protein product [Owenia fusiformis]|uniref:Delta-like protein n=1 Tax=Owenia fusiformis TaxID=6347 RepID=A0A8S4N883_OWEFU|nr:unnamed protein product [Owenia fusiformis]